MSQFRQWLQKQWRDISGNFKFWLVTLITGGIVTLAIALTHGLQLWQQITLAILFLVLFAIAIVATYAATRPKATGNTIITPENVESYLGQWLLNFNVSMQKRPKSEKLHFDYRVNYQDHTHIHIFHRKERSQYLSIHAHFTTPKRHKDLFDKLSEPEKKRFVLGTRAEVYRARINCICKSFLEEIRIEKLLPITTLTEADVIEQLDAVHASQLLVMDTISLNLGLDEQEGRPQAASPE
jgi:hypothetical protein